MKASATAIYHFLRKRSDYSASQLLGRGCLGCGCLGCGLSGVSMVCENCYQQLEKPKYACHVCGIAMAVQTSERRCLACIKKPPAFHRLDYVASYGGLVADWIVKAKVLKQAAAIEALLFTQQKALIDFDAPNYQINDKLPKKFLSLMMW